MSFESGTSEIRVSFTITGEENEAMAAAAKVANNSVANTTSAVAEKSVQYGRQKLCSLVGNCSLKALVHGAGRYEEGKPLGITGEFYCVSTCPNPDVLQTVTTGFETRINAISSAHDALITELR